MVELTDVNDYLGALGHGSAHLPFLSSGPERIYSLIFQPRGDIDAAPLSLSTSSASSLAVKMKGFLSEAEKLRVAFAACPEYSCPWSSLTEFVLEGGRPPRGSLWSICCESITPAALEGVAKLLTGAGIKVIEPTIQDGTGTFLNLVCHLFWVVDAVGNHALIALLQAKTYPMGGIDYERDHLIVGNRIFRFGNAGENRLVCLICSDVLGPSLKQTIINELLSDTIIIHLQLNKNSADASFRQYRELCGSRNPRTTEILCLNWAGGTRLRKDAEPYHVLVQEPKSIFYRPVHEIECSDQSIYENDKLGCFLAYHHEYRTAAYVFHPDEQMFAFRTSKPVMIGSAAVTRRTGLTAVIRYEWRADQWQAATESVNDKFGEFLADNPLAKVHLADFENRHVDLERLMQFATGNVLSAADFEWSKIPSFRLANDETSARMRACWSNIGDGADQRGECQTRFKALVTAIAEPSKLPNRLAAFRNLRPKLTYDSLPFKQLRNIADGDVRSTVAFLGFEPPKAVLRGVSKKLQAALYGVGQVPSDMSLLYLDVKGQLVDHMDTEPPSISDDPGSNPIGISTV